MLSTRETTILAFAASFAIALVLHSSELGHVPWAINRASGLAAYFALAMSTIFGLAISTKASDGLLARALVFELHQFLSVMALVLIAVHIGVLLFDGFLGFGVASLLVPFVAQHETWLMGLGVLSAWMAAITTGSFWVRSRIGYRTWRRLHFLTFACYVTALWHGVAAGTDTTLPLVYWMYVLTGAAVAGLLTLRIGEAVLKHRQPSRRVSAKRAGGSAGGSARASSPSHAR